METTPFEFEIKPSVKHPGEFIITITAPVEVQLVGGYFASAADAAVWLGEHTGRLAAAIGVELAA